MSREEGRTISTLLEEATADLGDGCVVLDLQAVRFATLASLSEINAALTRVLRRGRGNTLVLFALRRRNLDLRESLTCSLKEEKRLAVAVDEDGNAELLGEPTAAQKKTFQVVMAHRRMTSAELSRLMHVSTNAASTRLHVLHRLGLIGRKEMHPRSTGGREYVYYGVFCAPPK